MKALLIVALLVLAACSNDGADSADAQPDDTQPASGSADVEEQDEPVGVAESDPADVADEQFDGVHPDDLNPSVGPTEVIEQYDGLTIRLASLEEVPTSWAANVPSGHTVVRVTLRLENTSDTPVPLDSPLIRMALMYGPNMQDAQWATGYMLEPGQEDRALDSDDPRQVGPGETVDVFYSFEVPEDQLDELAVEATIEPERYGPVIFEDAHTLL